MNLKLGNLIATLPNATFANVGDDFNSRGWAVDRLHLTRDAYYDFAVQLTEVYISHLTLMANKLPPIYPSCMVPPLVKEKSAKQMKRERRQFLSWSAEMCRFTRPIVNRRSQASHQPRHNLQPHHPSAVHQIQPKPLHCYPMISYKNFHTKVAEKTFVKISTNTKQYIKHRQAVKVQKKQRAAKNVDVARRESR